MRKLRMLLTIVLAMMFSGYLFAQFTGDGFKNKVVGSPHDLSSTGAGGIAAGSTGSNMVCEYCHSPHKGTMYQGNADNEPTTAVPLLWNVVLPAGPFAVYGGSSTFQANDVRDPSTAGSTKLAAYMTYLCLSCHDGAITQASFLQWWNDGVTDTMGTIGSFTPPNIGGTLGLSNDHPVDFTYNPALASAVGGLQTPTESINSAALFVTAVGKTTQLPLFKDQSSDTSGRLECATCHNPHDHTLDKFLRMDNAGSALCLNCHGS